MLHPEELGELALKSFAGRAHYVSLSLEDSLNCRVNFLLNAVVLASVPIEGHGYPRSRHVSCCCQGGLRAPGIESIQYTRTDLYSIRCRSAKYKILIGTIEETATMRPCERR